ncbi:scavenger receptor cysteine-rich domain-containing protein DMBT1-like isoform X2 [Argopecten irradians]|uniref:scavenger receptor cysteine-rich domain-containing protein DMBT1-like isoform X2 n=1 Tax=Argopecten irradians TaxID=31199 RepID=UPI003718016E
MLVLGIIVLASIRVGNFSPLSSDSASPFPQSLPENRHHTISCEICPYIAHAKVMCVNIHSECDRHEDRCFPSLGSQLVKFGYAYSKIDYDGQVAWARTDTTITNCTNGYTDGQHHHTHHVTAAPYVQMTSTTSVVTSSNKPSPITTQDVHVALMAANGVNVHDGVMVITSGGIVYTACTDDWTNENSDVVCRSIGTPAGYTATYKGVPDFGVPVLQAHISCNGHETNLSKCAINVKQVTCTNNEVIHVTCSPPAPPPVDAFLLSHSGKQNEGLLIIKSEGKGHLVCMDGWTEEATQVVCRTIGAPTGSIGSFTVEQNGALPVIGEQFLCTGQERNITLCPRRQVQCHHNHVIHISCLDPATPAATQPTSTVSTTTFPTPTPTTTTTTPTNPTTGHWIDFGQG